MQQVIENAPVAGRCAFSQVGSLGNTSNEARFRKYANEQLDTVYKSRLLNRRRAIARLTIVYSKA